MAKRKYMPQDGSKRPRKNIGIVASKGFPVASISNQLKVWMANADQWDAKPQVVFTGRKSASLESVAHENGCYFNYNSGAYDFLWAFWNGRSRDVIEEMRWAARAGKRVVIFPV